MRRALYFAGFGYLAICGVIVLRHKAGALPAQTGASTAAAAGMVDPRRNGSSP